MQRCRQDFVLILRGKDIHPGAGRSIKESNTLSIYTQLLQARISNYNLPLSKVTIPSPTMLPTHRMRTRNLLRRSSLQRILRMFSIAQTTSVRDATLSQLINSTTQQEGWRYLLFHHRFKIKVLQGGFNFGLPCMTRLGRHLSMHTRTPASVRHSEVAVMALLRQTK